MSAWSFLFKMDAIRVLYKSYYEKEVKDNENYT